MKIVTWNMGKFARCHGEAWSYLRETLRPDIAFLQEARIPDLQRDESVVFRPVYNGWGTAVYARAGTLRELSVHRYSERVAAAILNKLGLTLAVVSIHAPIINNRVYPHLNHIFDDIEDVVAKQPAIVGGDLNSARLCEEIWPGYGHGPFFDRITGGPFVDCHWKMNGKEVQTFFRKSSKHPFQDDHIFASSDIASGLTSCTVVNNATTRRLSDHIPIMAEFDMAVG